MMQFLRGQSKFVLTIILAVIALGFVFYGTNGTLLTGGARGGHDFGRIGGQDLSAAQLYEAIQNTRLSLILNGQGQNLGRSAVAEEAWRQLLLLHEADRLHLEVSDDELLKLIQGMPVFQKDGVFDPATYQQRMSDLQNNFHVSPAQFEAVLRSDLRLRAVDQALFGSVRAPAADVRDKYQSFYGPAQLGVVTFDPAGFAAGVQVAPAEIEAEYKAHPDDPAYRTPEKRKVDYVLLSLAPDQARLPAKEKEAARQALGQKALDFALSFQPDPGATAAPAPDFPEAARKQGFAPQTTDFFDVDTPPAGLPPSPAFNQAAFALTAGEPVSRVVDLENGVAVLHLAGSQPSQPRPLAEVSAAIEKKLARQKAVQAASAAAAKAADALKAAVAAGTDFRAAAAAQKLKVETVPNLVPAKASPQDARLGTLAYASAALAVGQVSRAVPIEGADTFAVFHVDRRDPADPSGLADFEKRYRASQDNGLRQQVYLDWSAWAGQRPGTRKPPGLDQYGAE